MHLEPSFANIQFNISYKISFAILYVFTKQKEGGFLQSTFPVF